jgi:hypothetical protein
LSDEDLVDMLALMSESDSVELKLTVPEDFQLAAARALDVDPLQAQIRQVFFFETPDLALDRAGLAVRGRRVQGRADDSIVKLRPCVPHELPKKVRTSPNMVVEVDAMPGGHVCSASMKNPTLGLTAVWDVVHGNRPLRKLFSKEQRALFESRAPDGLTLEDLSVFGPIFVLKLKMAPAKFGRKLVAELWTYPDGSRVLELSTRTSPDQAFQVAAEARGRLAEVGLDLSAGAQTKTRTALQFFSKRAAAAADAAGTN